MTFTYKIFNLDLRYYDTNLSKENCFVLTGDPNARPGGTSNLSRSQSVATLELDVASSLVERPENCLAKNGVTSETTGL